MKEEKNDIGSVDAEHGAFGYLIFILLFMTLPITAPIMILIETFNKLKKKIWKQ